MNYSKLYQPEHIPPGPYVRDPVPCQQVTESRKLILAAAQWAQPGTCLILGAGHCAELPLKELAARFEKLTINDVDNVVLDEGLAAAGLTDAERAKCTIQIADLTGVTESLVSRVDDILNVNRDPESAIEEMAHLLDTALVAGMPIRGKYELVIASCVLSQLHFGLLHRVRLAFEKKFPGQDKLLENSVRWTSALYDMARRMEKKFIDDLAEHVAPGGFIYLSDSTQMCYVKGTPEAKWETEGTYRMLRTRYITDYLDQRFVSVGRERWDWVVNPPHQPGEVGRVYDVQGVVLRTWRT
jgi:hypothetical protein